MRQQLDSDSGNDVSAAAALASCDAKGNKISEREVTER
jgi:hypothetical protein